MRHLGSGHPLVAANILALFAVARTLRASATAGLAGKPLRGKNIALLSGAGPGSEPSNLLRAALDLGARVAEVGFVETTGASTARKDDVRALARMLGRMYDVIDCGTLSHATMRQIEQQAGVPVCHGLGLDNHPVRVLADLMTLCEHHGSPACDASILFLGDARTQRGRTFLSAAREMGFVVKVGVQPQASDDAHFVVDATRASAWIFRSARETLDEHRRAENHCYMIQSMLLDAIIGS